MGFLGDDKDDRVVGPWSNVATATTAGPLDRLAQADPSKVQQIVASQIELLAIYHDVVLGQARKSFFVALVVAGLGFCFFVAAVVFLMLQSQGLSNVALVSGALVEVVAGINFYLYNRASDQLADFQVRLKVMQRYVLANSICEGIDGELRHTTRAELVRLIAGVGSKL